MLQMKGRRHQDVVCKAQGLAPSRTALVAAFGGFEALVFTAGIGERVPQIHRRVCGGVAWFGFDIDETAWPRKGMRSTGGFSRVHHAAGGF